MRLALPGSPRSGSRRKGFAHGLIPSGPPDRLAGIGLRCAVAAAAIGAVMLAGQDLAGARSPSPPPANIRLSMKPVARINPLIYGVNYVWHLIPATRFRHFFSVLGETTHYTLARYPGGWIAERFDWAKNAVVTGRRSPGGAGVGPNAFLSAVPQASFVTPSFAAIGDPAQIPAVTRLTVGLVRRFGGRVKIWEIGNEWWLQRGGKNNPFTRERNLRAYAALIRAEAPAMKAAQPSIAIYATGDWTRPDEFAAMRRLVGPAAWSSLSGISIHGYCGPRSLRRPCERIPEQVAAIRKITGKSDVYDSEWSVGRRLAWHDFGIRNANGTVFAIADLAFAHMTAAAYWPPVQNVPATGLLVGDEGVPTATGTVFGWMARFYRGEALATSGDLPAVAARNGDEVTVIVPSETSAARTVRIALAGTGLRRVVSSRVLYSPAPDERQMALEFNSKPLPVTVRRSANGDDAAEFVIDPGTPGRGPNWEIARVTLR